MDIDQTDEPLSTMLTVTTRRWVKPYDFLWVYYGPEYQVVRQIIGYQLVPPTEQERIRPVFATRTIHHSCQCGCGSHTHAAGPAPPPANVLASIGIDPSPLPLLNLHLQHLTPHAANLCSYQAGRHLPGGA